MPTTWNAADKTNCNLTNGNLTATSAAANGGVRATTSFATGKYYWELTYSAQANGNGTGPALSVAAATFGSVALAGFTGVGKISGGIFVNGSPSGSSLGLRAIGDIIGCAVDLDARLIWFRVCPAGNWNGSGAANPATAVGGVNIAVLGGALFPAFCGNISGDAGIGNFGPTVFSGAVPSGFIGWDDTPAAPAVTVPAPRPGGMAGTGGRAWGIWAAEQKAARKAARKALGLPDDEEDEEDDALKKFLQDRESRDVRLGSKTYHKRWFE